MRRMQELQRIMCETDQQKQAVIKDVWRTGSKVLATAAASVAFLNPVSAHAEDCWDFTGFIYLW